MREVNLETNFNNKLGCGSFVHISLAPKTDLTPELIDQLMKEDYLVQTKDGSHVPVLCNMVSMLRYELVSLPTFCTLASHDMEAEEFIKWVISKKSELNFGTQMAVYFYKKKK